MLRVWSDAHLLRQINGYSRDMSLDVWLHPDADKPLDVQKHHRHRCTQRYVHQQEWSQKVMWCVSWRVSFNRESGDLVADDVDGI